MASSSSSLQHCSNTSTLDPSTPIDSSQCEIVESPMNGPCTSESASSLPWLWFIQAVACCNQIHISTLKELIDVAPVAQDDFCAKTRELIALRCLEDLFDFAYRIYVDDEAVASQYSGVGFDFSRSCEDVLHETLHKTTLSDLKKVGAELLKWDVFPFILHKRATVKCDLQQLKESISQGTHPCTYYSRESSGLAHQNGGCPVHVNNNECSDLSKKDNGNCSHGENMEAKENSVSAILENGNKSSKESLLDKILPSKRSRVESANEQVMGYEHEKQVDINECDDYLINAKKIRCSASLNVEAKKEKPVSHHGKKVLENTTEKSLLVSERGVCHTNKDINENLGEGSVEGSHDRCFAPDWCKSSSHNEVFHAESNIPSNATMMLQHTSGCEPCQQHEGESIPLEVLLPDEILHETKEDAEHKAVDDTVDACEEEISSDSDGYHYETIDLAAKKHNFLSCLCVKCHEVGGLLVCKTTTCPIMVHKSCLSTPAQIDAEGNFSCPFCAYYQAISEYREAKKKASLARKELAILFCKDIGHQNTSSS